MLDDYNGHFEPGTPPSTDIKPSDPNFNEENMLQHSYYISAEGSINISAPQGCDSYKWTFYSLEYDKRKYGTSAVYQTQTDITSNLAFYNNCNDKKREFRVYIPDSYLNIQEKKFLCAGTYKLDLTVMCNGKTYKDSCFIVIYEQGY